MKTANKTITIIFTFVAAIFAQDSICTFEWNLSNDCNAEVPCIDATIDGMTIGVPNNVSRISRTGLSLCLEDEITAGAADIIYIVDMSGSMVPSYKWWNCGPCPRTPGDPLTKRPGAILAGFEYQRDFATGSKAGYIGFASKVVTAASGYNDITGDHLVPLVDPDADWTSLNNAYNYLLADADTWLGDPGAGTNYNAALTQAIDWLDDPTVSTNDRKAIVFISDGNASGGSSNTQQWQIDYLRDNGIPVHGVYLSDELGTDLSTLANLTSGTITLVPPDDGTDTLAAVVENIVTMVTSYTPDTLTLTNNTHNATVIAESYTQTGSGWDVVLDSILHLYPGPNDITLHAEFDSDTGVRTIEYNFTVNVTESPDFTCVTCYGKTELELLDITNNTLDTLSWNDNRYKIRVTYHGADSLTFVDVVVTTAKGDLETVRISNPTVTGSGVIFEKTIDFAVLDAAVPATQENATTEANYNDIVTARWEHPNDPRDSMTVTAVVSAPPDTIRMFKDAALANEYPSLDTVTAGVASSIYARLFAGTSLANEPGLLSALSWSFVNAATGQPDASIGTLSPVSGGNVSFMPIKAYRTVRISATVHNGFEQLTKSIELYIKPNVAHRIVIEANGTPNPNTAQPISSITLESDQTNASLYAIIRDSIGNFISFSNPTTWNSSLQTLVTAEVDVADSGKGLLTRTGTSGTSIVTATSSGLTSNQVTVTVVSHTIDSLRIVVQAGAGQTDISNLTMRTDQDTMLLALGLRSTGGWTPVNVNWSITGANASMGAPSGVKSWAISYIQLVDTGNGTISISLGTNSDGITTRFLPGLPANSIVYGAEGDPSGKTPYRTPPSDTTVAAGTALSLVTKLFDAHLLWLGSYETDVDKSNLVSWKLTDASVGNLSATVGHATIFTPTKAHATVGVISTFRDAVNNIVLIDTVLVTVTPGPITQLVIEANPDKEYSPNQAQPLGTVVLNSSQSRDTVYAVMRDTYGNFVRTSSPTTWSSDSTSIRVEGGFAPYGEGILIRNGISGQATITATDAPSSVSGTVVVRLENYTINAIRIFVFNGINKNTSISTVVLPTDADTVLFAEGLRSTGDWAPVAVNWSISGANDHVSAPHSSNTWALTHPFTDTGLATVQIAHEGNSDQVTVHFVPGDPAMLDLYAAEGDPSGIEPYADATITVQAGTALPLVAKVFDASVPAVWLSAFETDPGFSTNITWSTSMPGVGTLSSYNGHSVTYTPTKAFNTVQVTAQYGSLSRTVSFRVVAGPASQLDIETSPERTLSPYAPMRFPNNTIVLENSDTTKSAYAVLRDAYGNFVSVSNPTAWSSNDTSVVFADPGFAQLGEGVIDRNLDATGTNTFVVAVDSKNPSLRDTANVLLIPYDIEDLRIVVLRDDSLYDIESLTMTTDDDTTLLVLGLRSDTKTWTNVAANWSSPGLHTSPSAPSTADLWSFVPQASGSGMIIVSKGTTADTIQVTFNPGAPASIALYPNEGTPKPGTELGSKAVVAAGEDFAMWVKVFDSRGEWLSSYEGAGTSSSYEWEIIESNQFVDSATGALDENGSSAEFMSTIAFRSVKVLVTFEDGFTDTITLTVVPGAAHHVVIEASPNAMQLSPNADNPLDTLVIDVMDTMQTAYAIVRDAYGNYIENSRTTNWQSFNESIVVVNNGFKSLGEGLVLRVDSGYTFVSATNVEHAGMVRPSDSVVVKAVNYYFLSLKIVDKDDQPVSSLDITTNDNAALYVIGNRSDKPNEWLRVPSARWGNTDTLSISPNAPIGSRWSFSPTAPGAGIIHVYANNDSTKPDTIPVTFAVGPPLSVEMKILTRESNRIAGAPITAVVEIKNRDGLVPGEWCYSGSNGAIYTDALSDGGIASKPTVTINGVEARLNTRNREDISMEQCFEDGLDTVTFTLFYAPYDKDSLHELSVHLGDLEASASLRLKPGALASLSLENMGGDLLDSVELESPGGQITIVAMGRDQYGNKRGREPSNWTVTDSLHAIERPENTPQIFYTASFATDDEAGYMIAMAVDSSGGQILDSIWVTISGPKANKEKIITRDYNGNGYLDAIEVHYDRAIDVPTFYDLENNTEVTIMTEDGPISFTVDSITVLPDSDSGFVLHLAEDSTYSKPQTTWTPEVTITGIPGAGDIVNETASDGAGPVIWRVIRVTSSANDHTKDKVTVVFSESFLAGDGSPFRFTNAPDDVFVVWTRTDDGLVRVDSLFAGIENFTSMTSDTMVFFMTNGQELTGDHLLSINAEGNPIADEYLNPVRDENRQVRVEVRGTVGSIVVGPNPIAPTFNHTEDELTAREPGEAYSWVKHEGGGVFVSKMVLPEDQNVRVKGQMMVFDAMGNLAYSRKNDNTVIPDSWQHDWTPGTTRQLVFYWNGITDRNRMAAPGVYRVVLFLQYSNGQQKKLVGNLGIGR